VPFSLAPKNHNLWHQTVFYEIVSAMQLSEINRVSGSVHLRVVPHCETLVMSEGIEDKEQASEVALTPGIRAQGSSGGIRGSAYSHCS
jgi:hypothetical protein